MLKFLMKLLLGVIVLLVLAVGAVVFSLRANIPDDTHALAELGEGNPQAADVLIFGATRGAGYEVAKLLRERGEGVTAFVRPTSDRSLLEPLDVNYVVGDGMVSQEVKAAFAAGEYRAVVTTLGCFSCDPPPDFIANRHIIDAASDAGVERLILVTSLGAGDSADATPWLSRRFLADILPLKEQAEEHLIASDLQYTIIRPGGLPPATAATGNGVLSEDRDAFGFIGRPDLAQLIVKSLGDDSTIGKTFAAVDTERTSPWSGD